MSVQSGDGYREWTITWSMAIRSPTIYAVGMDDANSDDNYRPPGQPDYRQSPRLDDDSAGFAVVESGGSTEVDESGKTDDLTVQLTSEPASDVVISVTSGDTGEVTVSPPSLTFGPR